MPPADVVERLRASNAPVVLAGPGVVHAGAVDDLRAFAAAANLGVLNTWGAKGVFDWQSPHHLATVGLQERDFELAGLADADLIITVGLDPREAPYERWALAPSVDVEPEWLAALAEAWQRPRRDIDVPPLRSALAAVTQAGWEREAAPLPPTRVTRHYGDVVGRGGIVAADPGLAGYWVARTLATTRPGAVHVPADAGAAGSAVATVVAAKRRDARAPALAVVDGPLSPETLEALEDADRRSVPVAVEVWAIDGEAVDAHAHATRLDAIVSAAQTTIVTVATDATQLRAMIDVAGPIVAWGGVPDPPG